MQGMQVASHPACIDLTGLLEVGTAASCIVRDLRGAEGCCRERRQIGKLLAVEQIVVMVGLSARCGVL
jgi:hypothetical protein